MGEGAFVKKEPAHVTISVWREKVADSLRSLIKGLPPDGHVIAVREPVSATTGNVQYLFGEKRRADLLATIRAIARQENIKPREVLEQMSKGTRFELNYQTKLPFLHEPKIEMYSYSTLSNSDPAVKEILKEALQLTQEEEIQKAKEKANKFSRSKRFKQDLEKAQAHAKNAKK